MDNLGLSSKLSSSVVSVAALLAALALTGCNDSGLKLAKVSGVVTVDGEPMAYAGVIFHPALGPIATGNTDTEGRFELVTANESGALIGGHVVTIAGGSSASSSAPSDDGTLGAPVQRGGRTQAPRFSRRYARKTTSDLRVTVEKGKDNKFVFELDKEGA